MSNPTTPTPPAAKPAGRRKFELDPRLKAYKGVWVFIEHERGAVHPVSFELLGEGRKLADQLGVELAGVVLGAASEDTRRFCKEAFCHGADLCYLIEDPVLAHYRNQPYTKALTDLVNKHQPEILLLGATTLGRDLAGSVATTLQTGLTADCTGLAIDPENRSLAATRPTFGGSLLCTIVTLNYRPQMATVRPRVMSLPAREATRTGRIIEETLDLIETDIVTKLLEFIADEKSNEANLPFADIIVAGGRGLKRPENFQLVWDLAEVLGAEVGATRPVVQAGWVSADRQVGQSGKTVRPKLYIAAGISGAVQHRVGMEGSDVIVAINQDANAPIFDFATYGIVGNAMQILPALTAAFRQQLATAKQAV
jgi:electron transfer flavoprotein alpha subunit